jgi:hypothetical protein
MDHKPECEWCNKPMRLWVYGQRFCCRQCSDEFHLAERRAAMEFFRTQRMTVRREEAETEPEDQPRSAQG